MDYPIKIISSQAELGRCSVFGVEHFQWTCVCQPVTYGRMGYIPGLGFFASMICLENEPLRRYTRNGEPVYKDSAMELFLALPYGKPSGETAPDNDGLYLNFEFNANGALYAKCGQGRSNREFIEPQEYAKAAVRAEIWPDFWSVDLLVPLELIRRVSPVREFQAGDSVYCNFYKISEDPAIEHYGSFHPVDSPTPNFHLPASFARAVLVP